MDERNETAGSGGRECDSPGRPGPDGGGEPACMLELVCPECGQVRGDAGAQRPCEECGAGTPTAGRRAAREQEQREQ